MLTFVSNNVRDAADGNHERISELARRGDMYAATIGGFDYNLRMFVFGRLTRFWAVTGLGFVLFGASACKDAQKEKARADDIQRKADETIAKVRSEAADKIALAQKKIDELENMLVDAGAQAKTQTELEVSKAKSEEEKLAAAAADALKKARAAYQDSERRELAALSKDLDEIRAKAQ